MKNRARNENENVKMSSYMPNVGCIGEYDGFLIVDKSGGDGSFDVESACAAKNNVPSHLVVMVNGINGSAQNWRFSATQFVKQYPHDVFIHCSECNSSKLTFDGVDVMGKRLADEVISVIKRYPDLQKISFIGHSLGGLIARYAIAILYGQDITGISSQENGEYRNDESKDQCLEEKFKGKIAGLEPMNFITFATPHLGSRGHKQVPVLCGFYTLEKVASHASRLFHRTGKHLFLTDSDTGRPPLLLQMVNDSDDLQFLSALQSFKRRVAYANARSDHLVGWSTSSLRHRNDLPKYQYFSRNDKYPHIVNVEAARSADPQQEPSLEGKFNGYKTIDLEDAMIRGLTKVSWERVDVNFSGSKRFLAHSSILVKNYWINSDGADVIQHMIDNFLL
ncbi:hypothetical protein F0562_035777 [Nyssa sinensis]|uniref:DUF676 domain-containing protein n=1 Tax=Nyssa sinensis TaxID=561372 RepID=A0A5J5AEZ2_9ASTE|nr:hypothetical protein F0562_035777 [Nyssa sinensis]